MSPTQTAILERLSLTQGAFVSGEELGDGLGVSRAAVAKAVAELRALGYGIESLPRRGHRLVSRPDLLLVVIEALRMSNAPYLRVATR